jgi:indole-3-glycerol phosphate synthase
MNSAASPTADVLATIVAATRRAVEVRREQTPFAALDAQARAVTPRGSLFADALRGVGSNRAPFNVIAECKRRSPSRGVLRAEYDPVAIAGSYVRAGAAALSILTEPTFFDGALDHLRAVRAAVTAPLIRKDFMVDEYQLLEARAAGADAILLIVAALDDARLATLQREAHNLGLAALVEVHTAGELERAQRAGATIIGVNSRNLKTLSVSLDTAFALVEQMDDDTIAVAESGIRSRQDLDALKAAGYDAFLIGERLMTADDPGDALTVLMTGVSAFAGQVYGAAGEPVSATQPKPAVSQTAPQTAPRTESTGPGLTRTERKQ